MEIEVQYIIVNDYGTYKGEIMIINQDQYDTIIELSKKFYESGFELNCEDGSFVVFPQEITRRSILRINKKVINNV
jgi:hypothetical protein